MSKIFFQFSPQNVCGVFKKLFLKNFGGNIIIYATMFSALPRAPSQVRVTEVQSTSVRLSWSYDGDAASEVQYYVIQYKPKVDSAVISQSIRLRSQSPAAFQYAAQRSLPPPRAPPIGRPIKESNL